MTKSEFITKIASFAVNDMQITNVAASLTIAQAALESAWGCSGLTKNANNLFGIKGSGNAGNVTMPTTEYVNGKPIKVDAKFAKYTDWGASIAAHSKLMTDGVSWNKDHYKPVLGKRGADAARAVAACGYATDPKYAEKLISIMNEWNLYKYDVPAVKPTKKDDKVNIIVYGKKIDSGKLIDGVTMVPLRDIGEAIGAKIGWDNVTKTATLTK
jgi:flagellum-specific peptidoglycan hydrolase FlgJ